jgi:hypothetical protein
MVLVLASLLSATLYSNRASQGRRAGIASATAFHQSESIAAASHSAGGYIASRVRIATASDNLPADCIPNASGPPGAPYELGVVGTVTGGVLTAGPTTVANISAKFCGIATIVAGKPPCNATGDVVSPSDGQIFGPLTAELTLIPGMQPTVPFTANPGTITGGFVCNSATNTLEVTVVATVSGTTGLFGLSCTIGPLTIPLSGELTGPLDDASLTLTGHDFGVPAVQASPTCAGAVPENLDEIAGLPIAPGDASATLPTTISIYQPGT